MDATISPGRNLTRPANNQTSVEYRSIYIACEITGICIMLITFYVLACLIHYGRKTRKFRFTGRKSDVNGGMVYAGSVVAVSLTIPRYIINQVIFNVPYIPGARDWCEVLLDIGNVCFFTAMAAVYVFLWLRQKALYGHPAMRRLAGKCIGVFSWITLVVLLCGAIAILLWFIIPEDYTHDFSGSCISELGASDLSSKIYYIALVGLLLVAQASLLSLFIYPMARSNAIQNSRRITRQSSKGMDTIEVGEMSSHRKQSKIACYMTTVRNTSRKLSTSSKGKSNTIQRTIRRSVICATISMLSDIVAMAIAAVVLPSTLPRTVNNTVYDICLIVSVLCVLATFGNYSNILTVFWRGALLNGSDRTSASTDDTRRYSEKSLSVSM